MEVVFIDWTPTKYKRDIRGGGQIRRYYAWITLNSMVNKVIPFRKENGKINLRALRHIFKKESKIWVEYGSGRVSHICVLFASYISSKSFILNVHDLIIQQKYIDKEIPLVKRCTLQIIEKLLLKRADTIIIPCPGLLSYITLEKSKKLIIMPPGVGEDELCIPPSKKNNSKKTALYFGSMKRKGMIPKIIELFSNLEEWDLHLVGLKEGENIVEKENVKYRGSISHDKLDVIQSNADVILMPLDKNDYLDKAMHMKTAYALKSCRPIIATKLSGISEYVSMIGLEENVIYIDTWDIEGLKEALQKAENLCLSLEDTIEKLKPMAWEPRFKKVIKIAFEKSRKTTEIAEWV